MKLEDAIAFWVTENGYRLIQTVFSQRAHGKSKYAQKNLLEEGHDLSEAEDAIEALKSAMEPSNREEVYFRGSPSQITNTHRREGFFAVAHTREKAGTYGDVYTVRVHKDVPRLRFGAEGGEVLLSDGMVYTYEGKTIHVRPPSSANGALPYLGNLYEAKRAEKNAETAKKYDALINFLYCYTFEEPDENIGYMGDCDHEKLKEFEGKPRAERIAALKDQLKTLPDQEKFLSDISLAVIQLGLLQKADELTAFVKQVETLVGGSRIRRSTRRTRRKRSIRKQRRSRRVLQNRR